MPRPALVALITERGGTKCALHRERRHTVPSPITFLTGEMGIPAVSGPAHGRLCRHASCRSASSPRLARRCERQREMPLAVSKGFVVTVRAATRRWCHFPLPDPPKDRR